MPTQQLADRSDFLAALAASGLLTPAQLAKATASLPPHAGSAAQTAQFLVANGVLTAFQADRLRAGRTDGFVIDSYAIQDLIGRGTGGRVYRAIHQTMRRTVAVKVLNSDRTRTPAARQAFQREVRAAARLNHPNVVTAYDANERGDRSYLVMEFVDGPTMAALVRDRGPLPVGEACELVRQVAVGLQHAHDLGMVHRDIKPQNLLVARASKTFPGCVVKIADFGIARLAPPPTEVSADTPAPVSVLGTPDYVAPEQAHAPHAADHRADLYSLGCVFYFLLTGRPPFAGGNAEAKLRRHRHEASVSVEKLRPDVPPAVAEIVNRLLAKDPNARFQAAAGLAARLDGLAARAVVPDDGSGLVSFALPRVPQASYTAASGYLTGMHAQPSGRMAPPAEAEADTSPWAQLTDEIVDGGPDPTLTPAAEPPAAPTRRGRVSVVAALALVGAVATATLAVAGYLLFS